MTQVAYSTVLIDSGFQSTGGSGDVAVRLAVPESGRHDAVESVVGEGMYNSPGEDFAGNRSANRLVPVGRVDSPVSHEGSLGP
jgi:hypothetical protein